MEIPKRGDIVFINAEPHAGKEYGGHSAQQGNIRRPMIVLSNTNYNRATGMIIGMVVTSTDFAKGQWYQPFADFDSKVKGNIVLWQLPTYDIKARQAEIVGHASAALVKQLQQAAIDIFE